MRENIVARRFFVSGRVQGVCFRWFTRDAAERQGLSGFVRNLADGRVEVLAIGSADSISSLKDQLYKGPELSVVTGVEEIEAESDKQYSGFSITY